MCGISGIISKSGITRDDLMRVASMSDALKHRGPDDSGDFSASHLALAARRLSIIDLKGGHQPLYNEDRSLALVANGEIYNYPGLRRTLELRGHRFLTGSDSEVIIHAYREYGVACLDHLRGMFAFALWDSELERLLLARDRMGEKPLYLYEQDGQLLFASELKALLRSGLVPFELDPEAINLYFHYQYVPEPKTPIKGVRKLDAAHLLQVDVAPWQISERCYWRMEDAGPLEGNPAQLIREQLETVSELVLRSDVPVGVALSGGLDSSVVAALASQKKPGMLQAFSVGYAGRPETDERSDAQEFANHLGLPFQSVELQTADVVEFFPELNYWRDDPIADIAGQGYFAVMKLARDHGVSVMLQGQGGDELFWGYPQLQEAVLMSLQKQALTNSPVSTSLRFLTPNVPADLSRTALATWARDGGGILKGWRQRQELSASPPDQLFFYDRSPDFRIAQNETPSLYGKVFLEQIADCNVASMFTTPRPWPKVETALTSLICATYLRENGIAQGDRLSMASSVEMRLPLVDHKLVETVIGLRYSQTDVHLGPKSWLKEAVSDLLPQDVMSRPKRGFAPPVREWHDAIFEAFGDSLRGGYLVEQGVLNSESAERLAKGPFPLEATSPLSFKALVLEQWCQELLSRSGANSLRGFSHG
jgi:asparagine synthase (glutamine-hydrolysing)